jgi:acetyltransferase EpsM
MKTDLVIVGAGGHGLSTYELALSTGKFRVVGFLDDTKQVGTKIVNDCSVIGKIVTDFHESSKTMKIAMGLAGEMSMGKRLSLLNEFEKYNYEFPTLIHPSAQISNLAEIAQGAQIHALTIIGINTKIGRHSVINSGVIVEHGAKILESCSISPGSVLCGNVAIGKSVFIGANSTILPGIKIGDFSIIGAGSLVNRNLEPDKTYYGVPARESKT